MESKERSNAVVILGAIREYEDVIREALLDVDVELSLRVFI